MASEARSSSRRRFGNWSGVSLGPEPETASAPSAQLRAAKQAAVRINPSAYDVTKHWQDIPPRPWLLGTAALRGHYTLITAPGGRGKTALVVMLAIAAATRRKDIAGMWVKGRLRVLLITGEDSRQEMVRRVRAACQYHGVDPTDLGDRLVVIPAHEVGGLPLNEICPTTRQPRVSETGYARLEGLCRDHDADILFLDPLVSFLPAGMNDNSVVSAAMGRLTSMADRLGIAAVLVHHVSKASVRGGEEASAMAGLGAVSLASHARVAFAIMSPTPEEATKIGVLPEEASRHIYLANTKANLTPLGDASWYKLHSVELPNADPARGYPKGDQVQAAAPFTPGTPATLYTDAAMRAVVTAIAVGSPTGPYSPSGQGGDRNPQAVVKTALSPFFTTASDSDMRSHARRALDVLVKTYGWLEVADVKVSRKPGAGHGGGTTKKGLLVRWHLTPWSNEAPPGPCLAAACAGAPLGNTQ